MAFENLFIRTEKFIGEIKLDAVVSESHTNTVRKTTNPIELGADVTDHAIIEPKKIDILGVVSDSPVGFAAVTQIVDTVSGLFGSSTSENATRSQSAYNALIALQELREPIEIQTKLKLYENMLITSVSVTQDKDTSREARLNIEAEEIFITESEVIQLDKSNLDGVTAEQASDPADRGRQEPKPVSESTNQSVLKSVSGWLS